MLENKTTIIAEAGVNHNGSLEIAKKLVEAASTAGADYVKFQTFNPKALVTNHANLAGYQRKNSKFSKQLEMLEQLTLSHQDHYELVKHCELHKIKFLSTAFDPDSLQFLDTLGSSLYKIPSGEINNVPYLEMVGSLATEVIISTGMAFMSEIKNVLQIIEKSGISRDKVTVLHCTTEYPASFSDVNLRAMNSIGSELKVRTGYSDHTLGIEVSIAAVAMGASVIEKHFTLDQNMSGPDHKASLNPESLYQMIKSIRNIEIALGDGNKRPTRIELENRKTIRKSLVASRPILIGETFTSDNITTKRPGTGLPADKYNDLIGRIARASYSGDEFIANEELDGK
ncbi:N-acetylneuraminate synthase [Planktomarina temperata]|nr:N-acetylneuraminate synthase [Planktomarina temperata]